MIIEFMLSIATVWFTPSINSQLDGMCRQEKVGFVDLWATFAGRPDLYRKDGLHMTDRGAEVLGAGLARAMGSGGAPFLN